MDYSAYPNLHQFNEEARKELQEFIDLLAVKYKIRKEKVNLPKKREAIYGVNYQHKGVQLSREVY